MKKLLGLSVVVISIVTIVGVLFEIYLDDGPELRISGAIWSLDYESPIESFPKDLVNEKLSEIFESENQNYVTNFLSPTEYLELYPHEKIREHIYNENTFGLILSKTGNNYHQTLIKEMLEEIPGVTKSTLVHEFVF